MVSVERTTISNLFFRKEYPPQLQKVEADHIRLPRPQGVGKLPKNFRILISFKQRCLVVSIAAMGKYVAKL